MIVYILLSVQDIYDYQIGNWVISNSLLRRLTRHPLDIFRARPFLEGFGTRISRIGA